MILSGAEVRRRFKSYATFSSGSTGMDAILGGGYRVGRTVEVFGKSNSGKTQLAMQGALCAARGGGTALFVDTEGSFRPERVESIATARGWSTAGVLERIVYVRVTSAAEQAETVREMKNRAATSSCRFVAIDTLTRNFSLDFPGSQNMLARQGALNSHLSDVARDAVLNRRAYLVTNRVTFSQEENEVGIGGRTVSQLVHASIKLTREGARARAELVGGSRSVELSVGKSGID